MNRQRIGFDRFIRLAWLDRTALLAYELGDDDALRSTLLELLAAEISGEKARSNTVGVLTRIWWRVPKAHIPLRDEALAQIGNLAPDQRIAFHWGMALLAYPLFRDVAAIVGRLLRLQGAFQLAQLSRRIGAEWGSRTTLEYAVPRILRSMTDWGAMKQTPEKGGYEGGTTVALSEPKPTLWLLETVLYARGTDLPLSDLLRAPELFPFGVGLSAGEVQRSGRFQLHQQGLDMVMVQVGAID